jgi:hypothetical protein
LKRDAIQHSLYGVDIDPGAVEIAKLRLWLSMVVDEEEICDIQPLPNLDYKIMQGNSLLEEFRGVRLLDNKLLQPPDIARDTQIAEIKARIAGLQADAIRHHGAGKKGAAQKLSAEQDIQRLKKQLDALLQPAAPGVQGELTQQTSWANLKRIQELREKFFDENSRARKDELRKQLDKLEWDFMEATLREQGHEEAIPDLKQANATHRKPFFLWPLQFAEVFQRCGGFDVIIGNPPWGQKAISLQAGERSCIQKAFPSSAGIFDFFRPFVEKGVRLIKSQGAFAMILPDIVLLKDYQATRRFVLEELALVRIDWWGMAFDSAVIDTATLIGIKCRCESDHRVRVAIRDPEAPLEHEIRQKEFWENPRFVFNLFLTPEKRKVLNRLADCPQLAEFYEVHEGVHSGNIRDELFVSAAVDPTCKKLLFGRDEIVPYCLRWRGKFIRLAALPARKSPVRYANAGRPSWYMQEKVLIRRTGDHILSAVDDEYRYASNNFFIVFPTKPCGLNLHGLCAILNSRFMTWYFRAIEPRQGRVFAEVKIKHINSFPLPKYLSASNCERINELGRKRAHYTRAGNGSEVEARQVDLAIEEEIFRLFNLTEADLQGANRRSG